MYGPKILVRSMSEPGPADSYGNQWNYHSRSDRHSKQACWGAVFDLLRTCPLLRQHVTNGKVAFGINHEMRDFEQDRKKDLDLVICTPASGSEPGLATFAELTRHYGIQLSDEERAELDELPVLSRTPVGMVLMALEAKACMTAHQKALPRLFDELNSSHLTVHGSSANAIAAGFVMINAAEKFLSPVKNTKHRKTDPDWTTHKQPKATQITLNKVMQLPRRSGDQQKGFDALAAMVVECENDLSPVKLVEDGLAPRRGGVLHYNSAIERIAHLYATRFSQL